MKATAPQFHLIRAERAIREPARIESEPLHIHEARVKAIRALGARWLGSSSYTFDPRHSNDPNIFQPARAAFLAGIANAAEAARRRNPAFIRAQAVRLALEQP